MQLLGTCTPLAETASISGDSDLEGTGRAARPSELAKQLAEKNELVWIYQGFITFIR